MVDLVLVGNEVGSFARELVHDNPEEVLIWVKLLPREAFIRRLPDRTVCQLGENRFGILEVIVRGNQGLEFVLSTINNGL